MPLSANGFLAATVVAGWNDSVIVSVSPGAVMPGLAVAV